MAIAVRMQERRGAKKLEGRALASNYRMNVKIYGEGFEFNDDAINTSKNIGKKARETYSPKEKGVNRNRLTP